MSAGNSTGINPTKAILELNGVESPLFVVVGAAAVLYIYSLASHLGMSIYHPSISEPSTRNLQSYSSAMDYKKDKVEEYSTQLQENNSIRGYFERKRFKANLSFLVSTCPMALIVYSVLIDQAIPLFSLVIFSIILLIGMIVFKRIETRIEG